MYSVYDWLRSQDDDGMIVNKDRVDVSRAEGGSSRVDSNWVIYGSLSWEH